ncbi:MAG TPA: Glu/Leu/Phe/Val dehydrogenase dimerization domain-containing protein [Labilithrix sp.]|nr:Glu/Leu/Phe/Val dehydrogenase dimerization domain-containing protein [Labilithrix sp.]
MNPSAVNERLPALYSFYDPTLDVHAYLAIDSLRDDIAFGGMRISPSVTAGEVAELARCMTWKLAAHGAPVGGAKAGIACDPSSPRLPDVLRALARAWGKLLESTVVLGKDMGARNEHLDELYRSCGVPQLNAMHAKRPTSRSVSRIRELTGYRKHMTGLGVAWSARAAMGGAIDGKRVAIQGFGAVGAGTAFRLGELGARVVAVSDAEKTVRLPESVGVAELVAAQDDRGFVDAARLPSGCTTAHRDALFAVDADALVLAAASHSVSEEHAATLRAPLVVEGANFGLVESARRRLHEKGVLVIPDVLANSSSAAMVCLQLASGNGHSDDALWSRIENTITEHVSLCIEEAARRGCTVREAYVARAVH